MDLDWDPIVKCLQCILSQDVVQKSHIRNKDVGLLVVSRPTDRHMGRSNNSFGAFINVFAVGYMILLRGNEAGEFSSLQSNDTIQMKQRHNLGGSR